MLRHASPAIIVSLGLVLLAAGCGTPPATTTAPPSDTPAASAAGLPDPDFAWALNGDGSASAGGVDLEFSGAHELSDEAVSFDGFTGYGATPIPGPLDTTASFSVSAWVNYADRTAAIAEAVAQLGEVTGLFNLGVADTGKWWLMMKTEDRTGLEYSVRVEGPQANPGKSWTHLVGIFDKEAGMLHLYVNGVAQAEVAFSAPLKANGPLAIGRSQFDSRPGNFWPGAIGDVALYQKALTAKQVAEAYRTTKPQSPPLAQPAPDPSTYANGILNGTWDYEVPPEDAGFFLNDYGVTADEVVIRVGFDNHKWWQGVLFDGELFLENGVPEGDGGTFHIENGVLVQIGAHGKGRVAFQWALDGDRLTLTVVEECGVTPTGNICRDDRSQMDPIMILVAEHTYTKSGDDPSY
ncbi:MAG: LamG domain-containing protein [Candidatus Limnocylindria bacterium]